MDKQRCIYIALCHDIAEAVAGDIPTYAGMSKGMHITSRNHSLRSEVLQIAEEKYKLEEFGIRYIESLLQLVAPQLGADIRAAWLEYESGNTPEATPESQWLREMDKFECMIQAHEYEQSTYGEENLEEFQGQASKISSGKGKELLEVLQEERLAHFQRRRQRTPVIFVIGISYQSQLLLVLTMARNPQR